MSFCSHKNLAECTRIRVYCWRFMSFLVNRQFIVKLTCLQADVKFRIDKCSDEQSCRVMEKSSVIVCLEHVLMGALTIVD